MLTNVRILSRIFDCLTLRSNRGMTRLQLLHPQDVYDTRWQALLKQSCIVKLSDGPAAMFALLELSIVFDVIVH